MIRWQARLAWHRVAAAAAGLLVAAGAAAALPAPPAHASSDYATAVVNFGTSTSPDNQYTEIYCTPPADYFYPANVIQVYNPCPDRIWVHYTSGSSVAAYCVNPGGAFAYDLPIKYAPGDLVDIQITSNPLQCDSDFTVDWSNSVFPVASSVPYGCELGVYETDPGYKAGAVLDNDCDFRIWLHQSSNPMGPAGQQLCLDPGQSWSAGGTYVYQLVQETYIQAPCDAGSSEYPATQPG